MIKSPMCHQIYNRHQFRGKHVFPSTINNHHQTARLRHHSATNTNDRTRLDYLNISGFHHLFRNGKSIIYKLFWFAILLTCLVFTLIQSINRINYFISRPVANQIVLQHDSSSFEFPAITVCFLSFYKVFWAKLEKLAKAERRDKLTAEEIDKLWNETFNEFVVKTYVACTAAHGAGSDMCGKQRVSEVEWDREHVLSAMGGCVALKASLNPDIVKQTGFIRISVQHSEDAMIYHKRNVSDMEFRPAGFYYYLHAREWNPNSYYALHRQRPVRLGEEIGLDIFIRSFEFINSTNHPCEDALIVEQCWRRCFHRLILQNTKCSLPQFNIVSSQPPCETIESIKDTCQATYSVGMDGGTKGCGCVRSCRLSVYATSLYSVDRSGIESKSVVTFRPDTLQEEYRDFLSYDRSALFSDLGGTMGLYLGFCIFTYIELVELLVQFVWSYFKRKMQSF